MLPYDLQLNIGLNLPYSDIILFTETNKLISEIRNDENFWYLKFKRDFPKQIIDTNITYKNNYMLQWHDSFQEFKKSYGLVNIQVLELKVSN